MTIRQINRQIETKRGVTLPPVPKCSMALTWTPNPILQRVVNRCIAEGAPVYEEKPQWKRISPKQC